MKKFLRLLLAAALTLSIWSSAAHAASEATLRMSSGEVAPGSRVTLTISMEGNPGLAATLLYVYYDTTIFTVETGDIHQKGGFESSGLLVANTIARAKENGRYDGDPEKDGVLFVWLNGSGTNVTSDGEMFSLTFQAAESAAGGEYEIGLGYSADDTANEQSERIGFKTESGRITVTGSANASEGGAATGNPGGATPGTTPGTPAGTTPGNPTSTQPSHPTGTTPGNSSDTPVSDPPASDIPAPGTTEAPASQTQAMPSSKPDETVTAKFADAAGHWAEEWIVEAAKRGLIQGYENGLYGPDDTMTRAQLVTILWRANGSPAPAGAASFTDLPLTWYRDAIAWAEENGVVYGIGEGIFMPEGTVTREQLAAILHRMAGSPTGMETMLSAVYDSQYEDSDSISSWAKQSLYWTLYQDIYCGQGALPCGKKLAPSDAADRAQIAVMMVRYLDRNG